MMVDPGIWKGSIDWEADSVVCEERGFRSVRVIMAEQHRVYLATGSVSQHQPSSESEHSRKKPGRPTVKPEIIDAYNTLKDAGGINENQPLKALIPILIKEMIRTKPENANTYQNLDDSTFRKALATVRKSDKSGNESG